MPKIAHTTEMNTSRVATAALQSFFVLTEQWGLSTNQQRALLGRPPESTFYKWKKERTTQRLDASTLERVSYLLGIHKALRILLPNEEAVREWVKKPNHAPFLNGQSALNRMLAGNVADLYAVRHYLDGQRG